MHHVTFQSALLSHCLTASFSQSVPDPWSFRALQPLLKLLFVDAMCSALWFFVLENTSRLTLGVTLTVADVQVCV